LRGPQRISRVWKWAMWVSNRNRPGREVRFAARWVHEIYFVRACQTDL
jgi:hypothetical protein